MAQIILFPHGTHTATDDDEAIRRKLLKVALNCAAASIAAALQMLDGPSPPNLQNIPDPGAIITFLASMG